MTRLNLILFFVLIMVCVGLVTSQHKTRKLYSALEQAQELAKKYNLEYNQLLLEQGTWVMHSHIEEVATKKLEMQVPDAKRIQVVTPDELRP